MKRIIPIIIIAIFAIGLFFYFINNLSPWNGEIIDRYIGTYNISTGSEFQEFINDSIKAGIIFDYLDIKNVFLIIICGLISASASLTAIHLIIDKLFFKKFYEEPNLSVAFRRSLYIPCVFIIFNILRLVNGFNVINFVIISILIIIMIIIETGHMKSKTNNG